MWVLFNLKSKTQIRDVMMLPDNLILDWFFDGPRESTGTYTEPARHFCPLRRHPRQPCAVNSAYAVVVLGLYFTH